MSLLPCILDDLNALQLRPSRTLNQQLGFGLEPEGLLASHMITPISLVRYPVGYVRSWRTNLSESDTGSTVTVDKNKYQVNLDVQHFQPEEISVKITDKNIIIVEGKHEEQEDDHGIISRHFVRKYVIPKVYDLDEVVSTLSSDGILTITTPKAIKDEAEERSITITQTGVPLKTIDKKTEDKQQ